MTFKRTKTNTLRKRISQTITTVTLTISLTTIGHLGSQTTPSSAYANPNHFKPDFTKYKPVNTKDYTAPDLYWREVADWKTPTGIECSVRLDLTCYGPHFPMRTTFHLTPGYELQHGQCFFHSAHVDHQPFGRWKEDGAEGKVSDDGTILPCNYASPYKLLPKGYKITYQDFTCAVGKDIDLACTNGIHGFVITPTDGWTY